MNASTRTLALTALLIAAATATSARADTPGGINGITLNGLSINGIGQTIAVTSNGMGASSLEVVGPCDAQTPCVRPAAQEATGDGATPRFQGRSARPLGDVGTAVTK